MDKTCLLSRHYNYTIEIFLMMGNTASLRAWFQQDGAEDNMVGITMVARRD